MKLKEFGYFIGMALLENSKLKDKVKAVSHVLSFSVSHSLPRKVVNWDVFQHRATCPCCGKEMERDDEYVVKCQSCGQRLKWRL